MRVVLDTSVVLSALLFARGEVAWLRVAWQDRRVHPLLSADTATELLRVLGCPKFRLSATGQEDLLSDYIPFCETVCVPRRVPGLPACRDACDKAFLGLAKAGRADAFVTGYADLLALRGIFCIPILAPRELRESLNRKTR